MLSPERSHCGDLALSDAGREVTLKGWIQRRRDLGGVIFLDLRDRSGLVQVVVAPDKGDGAANGGSAAAMERAHELRSEFVVEVRGRVAQRTPETLNPKLPTGEIEVLASAIEILARSATPPFAIDDATGAGEDLRLKYRYLDLRRPAMLRNFVLRDRIVHAVRGYLHERGYLEVETPILTKSTPEGARDYLVPSRVSRGEFYALPQSPQLFKQLLMVSGFERYYQIARCFRDEDLRSDRQPEFTQVDIEASFTCENEMMELIEGLFGLIFPLAGIPAAPPFRRLRHADAMARYGSDRPDTRFGLEITDLAALCTETALEAFRQPARSGGKVGGINLPGGAKYSRSRLDQLTDVVKGLGARGLVWMKRSSADGIQGIASPVAKHLDAGTAEALAAALGLVEGDLGLVVAGSTKMVAEALGGLRLQLARDEGLVGAESYEFLWITDFPLLEYDDATGRYAACHHPFTAPQDAAALASDPSSVRARAYDIVLNGLELGGGSIRIHSPEVQAAMFRALGIGDEEAREKFGFLLDAFQFGAPPHGGIALGLDRILMIMARAASIRDVIAFPKTASGLCLMTHSPSQVAPEQLAELGLRAAVLPKK